MMKTYKLEQSEIVELIEKHLLSVIREYHATRIIGKFPADDRLILKKIWEQGLGFTGMNLMCPPCIKYGLDVVGAWYDRTTGVKQDIQTTIKVTESLIQVAEDEQETFEQQENAVDEVINIVSPIIKNKGGRPKKK